MPYKVYFEIAGGKKLWIKKEFNTKSEAEKELKIAEKEIRSAVQIVNKGIVSTSPAIPKTVDKPKKTIKKPTEVPTTGLIVLKFVDEKGNNHLVGIAPPQLAVIKQAFTSIKCNQANISLTPSRMTIKAIDVDHVSIIKMTVPIRTGSGLNCVIDPSDFKKNISNTIYCLNEYTVRNLDKPFREFSLASGVRAQVNAKAVRDMLAPYSTGKNGKFYHVRFEIGEKSKVTALDDDGEPMSTSLPMRKLANTKNNATSVYNIGRIYNALKIFGSASIAVGMRSSVYPIAMSGINKGIKVEYICAPEAK